MEDDFEIRGEIAKVDTDLGMVFGWAIVSTENGQPYFDKQDDHIPEDAMLEAATEFMANARVAGEQHGRMDAGKVVFAWPMTKDIAATFNITTEKTGLMIGIKPDSAMLAKFKSGELTGFSIGGQRVRDEVVSDG